MKQLFTLALIAFALTSCKKNEQKPAVYEVASTSVVEWKGSAPDHFHIGSFDVEGSLQSGANGQLQGSFVIPIASIKNFNLPEEVKPQLLDHLKSPDFFDMVLYPNASFRITGVQPYTGTGAGAVEGANFLVTGDFTLIGQTRPIAFPARIRYAGNKVDVEATLQIDRTLWGMTSYSDPAEDLYILLQVDLHIKLSADRK